MTKKESLDKFTIIRFGLNLDDSIIDKFDKETGGFLNDDLEIVEDKLNYALRECRLEYRKELLGFIELIIEEISVKIRQIEDENSTSDTNHQVNYYLSYRLQKKKEFLKDWLTKYTEIREDHLEKVYQSRIFRSRESQLLFEYLIKNMGRTDTIVSFIYRKLIKDDYIFEEVKIEEYKRFLSSEYNISVDKIKVFDIVATKERLVLYDILIERFYNKK